MMGSLPGAGTPADFNGCVAPVLQMEGVGSSQIDALDFFIRDRPASLI
jgi:hypothetical protein